MIRCEHCGAENPDDAEFCSLCLCLFSEQVGERPEPDTIGPDIVGEHAKAPGERISPPGPTLIENSSEAATEMAQMQGVGSDAVHISSGDLTRRVEVTPGQREIALAPEKAEVFPWKKMIRVCLIAMVVTGFLSVLMEFIVGFVAGGIAFSGGLTVARIIVLVGIGVLGFGCAFWAGYEVERKGWLAGLISVFLYLLVFKPIEGLIVVYILTDAVSFPNPINRYYLGAAFLFFLPLGLLGGWLGEKRATGFAL